MKLHPRHIPTTQAENELRGFMVELNKKYDLTIGEIVQTLALILAYYTKYLIRAEREDADLHNGGT